MDCAYKDERGFYCSNNVSKDSLDLINRQKAEIEQLQHKYDLAVAEREANVKGFTEQLSRAKADVAWEIFAEIEPCCGEYRNNRCTGLQFITFLDELKQKYTGGEEK